MFGEVDRILLLLLGKFIIPVNFCFTLRSSFSICARVHPFLFNRCDAVLQLLNPGNFLLQSVLVLRSLLFGFALSRLDLLGFFADLLPGISELLLTRLVLLFELRDFLVFGLQFRGRLLFFLVKGLALQCKGCDLPVF